MALTNTVDLVNLRWRAAQWLLAVSDGDTGQATALLEAMRVEGMTLGEVLDEHTLLREQFARRPRAHLIAEITRLAQKLGVAP